MLARAANGDCPGVGGMDERELGVRRLLGALLALGLGTALGMAADFFAAVSAMGGLETFGEAPTFGLCVFHAMERCANPLEKRLSLVWKGLRDARGIART